jgi:hypothetical protein
MIMRMVVFSVTTCILDLPAEVQMYWIRTGMLVMLVYRCENFCAMNLEYKFSAGLLSSSVAWSLVKPQNHIFYMLHSVLFLLTLLKFSWHIVNFVVISAKYMCVVSLPLSVCNSHIIKAVLWNRWAITTTSSMIAGYRFHFDLSAFLNLVLWCHKWKSTVHDSWCVNCHWAYVTEFFV